MWTRRELKERAKEALQRNYWKIVLVSALLFLLGCEAGGYNFSAKFFHTGSNGEEKEVEEMGTVEETVTMVTAESPSGDMAIQVNGSGETAAANIKVNVFGGSLFGITAAIIFTSAICVLFVVVLLADIFLINPVDVGGRRFMRMSVEGVAQVKETAYGFDHSYKNVVRVMFFRDLYIFLWTLLFIIPGIVKMYQYLMVPYILSENPDMEYHAALQMSRDMMYGNKWRAFVLGLSFILWDFLGMLTLGILEIFYVHPYRNLTFAALYCELKGGKDGLQNIGGGR